jgi:predicted alpha/beta-hydrolase family hydrolase
MSEFLTTGPDDAAISVLLAHGAGAPMDSAFMNIVCELLAERGIRTLRFEFPYMASRRRTGKRKPAPKAETLMPFFVSIASQAANVSPGKLIVGGKSMGGRVASLVADELRDAGVATGLVCLGYPFHPPGMPEKLRTGHLEVLRCPALIVQGERDPFGSREEASAYPLAKSIALEWIGDGDHDLGPRGGSGFTRKGNLAAAADAVAAFCKRL